MILRTAAVLAFAILPLVPLAGAAQEPVPAAERTHVVQAGETLAEIARVHLGSAAHWDRIWEANRDAISDPHRILPGLELRIPGETEDPAARVRRGVDEDTGVEVIRGGDPDALAEVTGVLLEGGLPEAHDTLVMADPDDRRQLLRSRGFQPRGTPTSDRERTVFYGSLQASAARSSTRPGVIVSGSEETLALTRSAFNSAAWLSGDDDVARIGQVEAFVGDEALRMARTAIQLHDDLQVQLDDPNAVAPGDILLAYHRVGEVDGFGDIKAPSGVLEVRRVEGDGAVVRVRNSFDRFSLGHEVARPRTFPLSPGVHPSSTELELDGTLVGFRDRKEIYLPGDQAFLDRGAADDVAVGDEFVGVVGDRDGWEGRQVARFQVIRVEDGYSTIRLLASESPSAVRPGLTLVLDRKMP
jgi:hypothetical protein